MSVHPPEIEHFDEIMCFKSGQDIQLKQILPDKLSQGLIAGRFKVDGLRLFTNMHKQQQSTQLEAGSPFLVLIKEGDLPLRFEVGFRERNHPIQITLTGHLDDGTIQVANGITEFNNNTNSYSTKLWRPEGSSDANVLLVDPANYEEFIASHSLSVDVGEYPKIF